MPDKVSFFVDLKHQFSSLTLKQMVEHYPGQKVAQPVRLLGKGRYGKAFLCCEWELAREGSYLPEQAYSHAETTVRYTTTQSVIKRGPIVNDREERNSTNIARSKNRLETEVALFNQVYQESPVQAKVRFDESDSDCEYFMRMPYLGESLHVFIHRESRKRGACGLNRNESLDIMMQSAQALKQAHDSGVIHGDVKPDNIARNEDGTVKLIDFGLSFRSDESQATGSGGAFCPYFSFDRVGLISRLFEGGREEFFPVQPKPDPYQDLYSLVASMALFPYRTKMHPSILPACWEVFVTPGMSVDDFSDRLEEKATPEACSAAEHKIELLRRLLFNRRTYNIFNYLKNFAVNPKFRENWIARNASHLGDHKELDKALYDFASHQLCHMLASHVRSRELDEPSEELLSDSTDSKQLAPWVSACFEQLSLLGFENHRYPDEYFIRPLQASNFLSLLREDYLLPLIRPRSARDDETPTQATEVERISTPDSRGGLSLHGEKASSTRGRDLGADQTGRPAHAGAGGVSTFFSSQNRGEERAAFDFEQESRLAPHKRAFRPQPTDAAAGGGRPMMTRSHG